MAGETRSAGRLRAHYEVERELADRLRGSSAEERVTLYTAVYEELFERVPDHPQLVGGSDSGAGREELARQVQILSPFLDGTSSFLEIGAGDCALSREVATFLSGPVHAVDVSPTIVAIAGLPENVEVHITDGTAMPVPDGSVDVAYSNQLLEHLHPDDAVLQTRNVHRALAPGGAYVCLTPSRLTGPHDISMFFDTEPRGFHLREYATYELVDLFRAAGFTRVVGLIPVAGRCLKVPSFVLTAIERGLEALPGDSGRAIARRTPLGRLFGRAAAIA